MMNWKAAVEYFMVQAHLLPQWNEENQKSKVALLLADDKTQDLLNMKQVC